MNLKSKNWNRVISLAMSGFIVLTLAGCADKTILPENTNFSNTSIETSVDSNNILENEASTNSVENDFSEEEIVIVAKVDQFQNEDDVVNWIQSIDDNISNVINKENFDKIKDKVWNGFTTVVDFLFYGDEIGGYTFSELSMEAKYKVLLIAGNIDNKIEEYLPNYKENVKNITGEAYSLASDKIKNGISYIDGILEEEIGSEKYNQWKETFNTGKDKVSDVASDIWETTKETGNKVKTYFKDWYEDKKNE